MRVKTRDVTHSI